MRRKGVDFRLVGHLEITLFFGRCSRLQCFGITDKIDTIFGELFVKSESVICFFVAENSVMSGWVHSLRSKIVKYHLTAS